MAGVNGLYRNRTARVPEILASRSHRYDSIVLHRRSGTVQSYRQIFVLFMIGMIVVRRRQAASAVQRENYV